MAATKRNFRKKNKNFRRKKATMRKRGKRHLKHRKSRRSMKGGDIFAKLAIDDPIWVAFKNTLFNPKQPKIEQIPGYIRELGDKLCIIKVSFDATKTENSDGRPLPMEEGKLFRQIQIYLMDDAGNRIEEPPITKAIYQRNAGAGAPRDLEIKEGTKCIISMGGTDHIGVFAGWPMDTTRSFPDSMYFYSICG